MNRIISWICAALWLLTPLKFTFASAPLIQMTAEEYIGLYKDAAIENMYLKNIPASITLAQGMLESGNGNSELARKGNNHFGIKCHNDWQGRKVYQDDNRRNECFRAYPSVLDSYKDHADFLSSRERYRSLFMLDITDYKGWAHGLKKAGYATDSRYPQKLIELIERHRLHVYDRSPRPGRDVFANTGGSAAAGFAQTSVNGVLATIMQPGETKVEVAARTGVSLKKIDRYNELGPDDEIAPGEVVFLKKKKGRATRREDFHVIREGETMWSVSQQYGIRLNKLLKRNNRGGAYQPQPGDKIYLRKFKPMLPPYKRFWLF